MLIVSGVDRGAFSLSAPSVNKNRLEESRNARNSLRSSKVTKRIQKNVFWGIKEDFIL